LIGRSGVFLINKFRPNGDEMKKKSFYQFLRDESMRRKRVEEDLRARLSQQEAIAWLGEYAIRSKGLNILFSEAVELVARTINVDLVKILQFLPEENEMLLRAGVGWKKGMVGNARVGAGVESHAGFTLIADEPVIVSDLSTETRFYDPQLLEEYGVVSGMSAVIRGKERPWGVLGTHTLSQRVFSEHDTRFLVSIASILASAIERFHTEEELRRSHDELEIILNGVSEGITAQAPDGKLLYANPAAMKVLGFTHFEELRKVPVQEVRQQFQLLDEAGNPFPVADLPGRRVFTEKKGSSARIRFRYEKTAEENWSIVDATPVFGPEGNVVQAVSIFRNITELIANEHAQKLLAEAGKLFAESLNYEETMTSLANLVVNHLADWCTVHLVTAEHQIQQIAVAHKDPQRVQMALDLQQRYPPNWNLDSGIPRVLRTGEAEYYPEVTEDMLVAGARDAEHLASIRELGFRAAMVIPLNARKRTLGTITLVWSDSGRRYSEYEVGLVQELSNRAAIAIENVFLFQETQSLNAALEMRVALRTQQLELANTQLVNEIDERRKAETALRKSQAMLNSLFESAPDATILVDRAGVIIQVNKQAEMVFGWQREDLVGSSIDQLLPNRYQERHVQNRESYFQHMTTRLMGAGLELYANRKDGTEFPVDVMLSPIHTDDGDLVISAVRDITEQKKLQFELAETHRRLFESIEAERKLLSQELHDGPLQDLYGVALSLEGIRPHVINNEDMNDFDTCKTSVQNVIQTLRAICGDLRPPALSHFGLEKTIRSHLTKFRDVHPELNIEVHLENDGNHLPDRTRLALFRVYQNTLANILRHAEAKNVKIDLHIDEEQAVLIIIDDGRGFRVPSRWVELARNGHFGLVGMQERVEAIGGHLDVQSDVGKGTTIQVNVPLDHPS
jgi:PAS domain S-box-containing protein